MKTPYLGVLIEQKAGGPVTVEFSDRTYKHPDIQQATIWGAIAGMLEHYFTVHAEVVVMAHDETSNVHYLPKPLEYKRDDNETK